MFILKLDYCDFFIWPPATSTNYPIYLKINIEKNDEFISNMSVKLQNYFFKVLLFEVVTRKNDICSNNNDAEHCDIEWYHYACVNIKIAPKGSWFCENCTTKNKKKITKN